MSEDVRKFLIFTLAGRLYAFDLSEIAEVVEQPVLWPIPLAPPCYLGAMNFHGAIVAVMDLAGFFGMTGVHSVEHVIVLDTRIASLSFATESIVRIILLDRAGVSAPQKEESFAVGELNLPEGRATLLNAAAIAEHAAETINT